MYLSIDFLLLFILVGIAVGFWLWRKQDEFARNHAIRICQRNHLQLLDIARKKSYPSFKYGISWLAQYQFGFSSDGETRYEGQLELRGFRLSHSELPPYRVPVETQEAPKKEPYFKY